MFGKIKTAVLVSLLVFSVSGYSYDENARYTAIGSVSCGKWVEYREANNSREEQYWISGYLTAYNELTPDVYNIMGNADGASIYLWMDKYCRENSLENLFSAIQVLTAELYPNRIVKYPE